jgi:hypothetical protein
MVMGYAFIAPRTDAEWTAEPSAMPHAGPIGKTPLASTTNVMIGDASRPAFLQGDASGVLARWVGALDD